jgi:choline-sulfatase
VTDEHQGISRRGFIRSAGATAAGLYGMTSGTDADATTRADRPIPPFRPRGGLRSRPNFLVVLSDEYRFPPVYETDETRAWRATHLTAFEQMRNRGLEFTSHYVMAAACTPSRASLFTGHYPPLHGVTQTTGVAKESFENDQFWLDPDTVPTLGDYFRAGGYDTYYKGKWHLSDADLLIPGTHDQVVSFDDNGVPDPEKEQLYLDADRLDEFGFTGWIGPEPHGKSPLNSASSPPAGKQGRDEGFAQQAVSLLGQLRSKNQRKPWLVVTSFVNAHDVTLWGDFSLAAQVFNLTGQLDGTTVPDALFDPGQYAQTSGENLSTNNKPACQQSYVDTYPQAFQPTQNDLPLHKFYYQMQQNVDGQIQKVLDALGPIDGRFYRDTIVVFTSDHGEMLGAHGGMHQKWHQAYEETTHVPFIVHNPQLFAGRQTLDVLTSHADLVPTLLGLAGLDAASLQATLAETHDEVHPLVGRDLSGLILGEVDPATVTDPVYFMTDDEISRGDNQVSPTGLPYESVIQPNHVETVIARLPTGAQGALEKWKYSRYFDSPQFWSDPATPQDVVTFVAGPVNDPGPKVATTTVKTTPVADEIEAYNLALDPLELNNLADSVDSTVQASLATLATLLAQQCAAKRVKPSSGVVPGQIACTT